MKHFFHSDSAFFQKLTIFSDLVLLNLLTILCSLPLFTVGTSITALYYAVTRLRQQDDAHLFRAFFHSFRENFRQSVILWLLLLPVGVGAFICILLYDQINMPFLLACSVLALVVCGIAASWLFPMLARFHSSVPQALKNALLCGSTYLPLSLAMTLVNLIPLALFLIVPGIFTALGCVWLFIWFSLAAYCNCGLLESPFSAIVPTCDTVSPREPQ